MTTRTLLGAMRATIGLAGWLAPDGAARAFGIDPGRADRFVTRLFASRELALATALMTAGPERQASVATVGALIDSADLLAGIGERRRGNLSGWAFVSGALGAGVFAAMGFAVAREASAASDAD